MKILQSVKLFYGNKNDQCFYRQKSLGWDTANVNLLSFNMFCDLQIHLAHFPDQVSPKFQLLFFLFLNTKDFLVPISLQTFQLLSGFVHSISFCITISSVRYLSFYSPYLFFYYDPITHARWGDYSNFPSALSHFCFKITL